MKITNILRKKEPIQYLIHPKNSIFASLQIRENHEDAFENAIKRGMKNPDEWMYMYSKNGRDYFKHYFNRTYKAYRQFAV